MNAGAHVCATDVYVSMTSSENEHGTDTAKENCMPHPSYPLHKDTSLGLSSGRRTGDLNYHAVAKVVRLVDAILIF